MEAGSNIITSMRLPNVLTTWAQIEDLQLELRATAIAGRPMPRSLVYDTATALERIIHTEVLERDTPQNRQSLGKTHSMETAHGGYGKAYAIANNMFETFLNRNDELAEYGGINIILTCHVFVVRIVDPSAGEYDTFELLMHSPKNAKNYGKREHLTQWADGIFFLHSPIIVTKNKDEKISRGLDANRGRILEVERSPAWTAKNRYGLTNSIQIPKIDGWNHLAKGIYDSCGIDIFNRELVPTKIGA
jgi:hypothetical protein